MAANKKVIGGLTLALALLLVLLPGMGLAGDDAHGALPADMDLGGSWWEVQRFVDRAEMPIFGEQRRETTAVMRVEIVQSGSQLLLHAAYCSAGVRTAIRGLEMVFPQAFVRSLASGDRYARLDVSAGSTLVGFEQEWYVEVRGAVLDDPGQDLLPTAIGDPRIIDQDGDGHPGMTVEVDLLGLIRGQVYVVQRIRYRLIGLVERGGDSISGRIEWEDEQVVIGATSFLLAAGSAGIPAWEESSFRLERANAGAGCDQAPDVEETRPAPE